MALGTSLIDESAYAHHSDNDLGLAVIERWTYYFIENYYKTSNHQTTLEQVMINPFIKKNLLLARVGIKDDTSHRKFKDTRLAEFFGIKGGVKYNDNVLQRRGKMMEISPDNLRKLPLHSGSIAAGDQDTSRNFE